MATPKCWKPFCTYSLLVWFVLFMLTFSDNVDVEKDTVQHEDSKDYVEDNEEGEARRATTVR